MTDISHLLTETCTIIQRRPSGMTDRYGNPLMTETEVTDVKTHVQSVAGSMGTNGVYYTGKAYFESTVDVADDDQIEARGKKFWVNSAELHVSPTSSPSPYKSVQLRETEERQVITSA